MRENLQEESRHLLLDIATKDSVNCGHCYIVTNFSIADKTIQIEIEDIVREDNFPADLDIAKSTIDLGYLSPKEYQVTISLKNVVASTGKLIVSAQSYQLLFDDNTNGFVIENSDIRKLSDGLVWGYVGFDQSSLWEQGTHFINTVNNFNTQELVAPGDYGYFVADNNNVMNTYRATISQNYYIPILMKSNATAEDFSALLQQYPNSISFPFHVEIFRANGGTFKNF